MYTTNPILLKSGICIFCFYTTYPYHINIPYGQLSVKLPVIRYVGQLGHLGNLGHLDHLGNHGHLGHLSHPISL